MEGREPQNRKKREERQRGNRKRREEENGKSIKEGKCKEEEEEYNKMQI